MCAAKTQRENGRDAQAAAWERRESVSVCCSGLGAAAAAAWKRIGSGYTRPGSRAQGLEAIVCSGLEAARVIKSAFTPFAAAVSKSRPAGTPKGGGGGNNRHAKQRVRGGGIGTRKGQGRGGERNTLMMWRGWDGKDGAKAGGEETEERRPRRGGEEIEGQGTCPPGWKETRGWALLVRREREPRGEGEGRRWGEGGGWKGQRINGIKDKWDKGTG